LARVKIGHQQIHKKSARNCSDINSSYFRSVAPVGDRDAKGACRSAHQVDNWTTVRRTGNVGNFHRSEEELKSWHSLDLLHYLIESCGS
jgi:hypothetical protein